MSGVTNTVMGAGWAMTALAGGHVITRWGYPTLFLIASGGTMITVLAFVTVARHLQEDSE